MKSKEIKHPVSRIRWFSLGRIFIFPDIFGKFIFDTEDTERASRDTEVWEGIGSFGWLPCFRGSLFLVFEK
jgi:hypothetical protein